MSDNPYRAPRETETKARRRFRFDGRWSTVYLAAILTVTVGAGIYSLVGLHSLKMATRIEPDPSMVMPRSVDVLLVVAVTLFACSIAGELWKRLWPIEPGDD